MELHNYIFYFSFGYHCPVAWKAVPADPGFDMESTGILPIRASDDRPAAHAPITTEKWRCTTLFKYEWGGRDSYPFPANDL
jgi:hypothetical protein